MAVIICMMQFAWVQYILEADFNIKILNSWIILALIFNLYFLIELFLYFYAFGSRWVFDKKKILIFEITLQLLVAVATFYFVIFWFSLT